MRLVADAGPVIALAKIDHLALLEPLFEEVWLPEIVQHEVLAKPGPESRRIQAALQKFLRVGSEPVSVPSAAEPLTRGLDDAERSVIALASVLPPRSPC